MSHSMRMERFQLAAMVFVLFGLLALAIPLICSQFVPKTEVQPVEVPGRQTVHFEKAGTQVIYYEKFLDDDSSVQEAELQALPKLKIEISKSDVNRGWPLTLSNARDEYLYTLNRRKGISLYTCQIPEPGDYIVKTYYRSGDGPSLRLAIGERTFSNRAIRMTMLALIIGISITTFLTVILFIIKIMRS